MAHVRRSGMQGVRSDVDASPVAALAHEVGGRPAHQEETIQVHPQHAAPLLEDQRIPGNEGHDGRCVQQHVQLAAAIFDPREESRHLVRPAGRSTMA